ncbi:hypothetical protein D3C72_2055020 [compost metagenome]
MPRYRLVMISCAICERSVARGAGAVPGACSTWTASSRTWSKRTVPLSVWRWPNASQSGFTVMPSARVGNAAISAVPDALCQAEIVSRSDPTDPELKPFTPSMR